jgi:hypothetical protein
MFERWLSIKNLAFLAAFGESLTGRLVCQRILGYPLCANPCKTIYDPTGQKWISQSHPNVELYDFFLLESKVQLNRMINLEHFARFVESHIPIGELLAHNRHPYIQQNLGVFQKIACGFDIWDRSDPSTQPYRLGALKRYGALFSNNQGAERGNKDQNLAASNNRDEQNASIRIAATSCIKEMTSATILGEKRAAFCGNKRICEMDMRIDFVLREVEEMGRQYGESTYFARHSALIEGMWKTFTVERQQEAKENFERVLSDIHVQSAKEKVSGIDVSAWMRGLIQFGKIFQKNGPNLVLLQVEWKGRQAEELEMELPEEEIEAIDRLGINKLKKLIKQHEKKRTEECEEEYNAKFFKPSYTNFEDYEWSAV